jgi:hypothetical protein
MLLKQTPVHLHRLVEEFMSIDSYFTDNGKFSYGLLWLEGTSIAV